MSVSSSANDDRGFYGCMILVLVAVLFWILAFISILLGWI